MKKSKAFWICTALCLVMAVMMIVAMQAGMTRAENAVASGGNYDPDLEMFLGMKEHVSGASMLANILGMGFNTIFIGVFIAIFLSSEFGFGTMKNTLSRGADRIKVYFSKLLTCGVAALVMQLMFMLAALAMGSIIWGFDPQGVVTAGGILGMMSMQLLLTLAFSALFTFVSMSVRAGGGSIAINIVCVTMVSTLLSALSMLFGGGIDLNNYWIGESVSKLATIAPVSGDIVNGILIALAWGTASILAGTMLFRKQDVK